MMDKLEQERYYVKTMFNAVFPIMKDLQKVIKIHHDEIRCDKDGFTLYDDELMFSKDYPVCKCKDGVVYGAKDELEVLQKLDFDLTCIYSVYYENSSINIEERWIHDMFNPGYKILSSFVDVKHGYCSRKDNGMYVILLASRLKKQMFGGDVK